MTKRTIRAKRGRTAALGSAVALLAAGISGGLWAGANAVAPTLQPGVYILVGAAGGLCLSAPADDDRDGVQLEQQPCGKERQRWRLAAAGDGYTLTADGGACAGVQEARTSAGAAVQREPCRKGAPSQSWITKAVDGGHQLVNAGSGKCLAVEDGSGEPGARVQQNSCDSAAAKRWTLKATNAARPPTPGGTPTPTATAKPTPTVKPTATTARPPGSFPDWPDPKGEDVPLTATQKVTTVFDGGGRRFVGKGALGGSGQSEKQPAMFELAHGAVLQDVILGNTAADGVHCKGSCTLRNVWWENVGEDAATFKSDSPSQTMTVNGGGARDAADKVFQHNGPGTFVIRNFQVEDFGKLYRSCGNCKTQHSRHLEIDNVRVTAPGKAVAGINSNFGDTAKISRLVIEGSGHPITVCQRFQGVTRGEPKPIGSGPDASHCLYTPADVTHRP
ncbi:pectate lyase [Streptomyces sp. NPDC099050]|uniref:pectate lyase n=1 Tax=Streptomyces sp. NPDC099050 TaxID=3366100 RepID=UPI0038294F4B